MSTSSSSRQGRPGTPTRAGGGDDPRSLGTLVNDIIEGVRTLVRTELELIAKELQEAALGVGQAVGAAVAAAIMVLFGVGFLGVSLGAALDLVVPAWLAWLIVAGVFLLLAVIAGLVAAASGRRSAKAPQRLQESMREDLEWVKEQQKRLSGS